MAVGVVVRVFLCGCVRRCVVLIGFKWLCVFVSVFFFFVCACV